MLINMAVMFALVTVPPDSGQYTRSGVWYNVRGSGAAVAIDLALVAPTRGERLVLIAPSVSGNSATRAIPGFDAVRDAVLAKDWPRAGEARAATPVMRRMHDTSDQASIVAIVSDNIRLFRADRSRVRPGTRAVDRLQELAVPVLVVMGSQDPSEANDAGAWIVERVRGARAETLAGCGHLVPFDCPEATATVVGAFLAPATTR